MLFNDLYDSLIPPIPKSFQIDPARARSAALHTSAPPLAAPLGRFAEEGGSCPEESRSWLAWFGQEGVIYKMHT